MKSFPQNRKALNLQRQKDLEYAKWLETVEKIPIEKFYSELIGAKEETSRWLWLVYQGIGEHIPLGSVSHLIAYAPLFIRASFIFIYKALIDNGINERKAKKLTQQMKDEFPLFELGFFCGKWDNVVSKQLEILDFEKVAEEVEKSGIKMNSDAVFIIFKNYIYYRELYKLLQAEHDILKKTKDSERYINIYLALEKVEVGEMNEFELPRSISALPQKVKADVLESYNEALAPYSMIPKEALIKNLSMLFQNQDVTSDFQLMAESGFSLLLKYVETPTGSLESKLIALQPYFCLTGHVLSFRDWAEKQGVEYGEVKTFPKSYRTYLKQKLEQLVKPPVQ